jgi:hypothetical protein
VVSLSLGRWELRYLTGLHEVHSSICVLTE